MLNSRFDNTILLNIVAEWNVNFPIDHWWRRKHSIPFNSPKHREVSFLDMYFEFVEDRLYRISAEKILSEKDENDLFNDKYVAGKKNFLKQQEGTDGDYDDIDLSQF